MRWQQLLPAGGAALGGIVGAVLGIVVGAVIAAESVVPSGQAPHESAFAGLLYLPGILVGAGVGGVVLAVGGAVFGSWVGARFTGSRAMPRSAGTPPSGETGSAANSLMPPPT